MSQPQILINNINYSFSNSEIIFKNLTVSFAPIKIGIVGRNGIGKSTLFKLIVGEFPISNGSIQIDGQLSYVPQNCIFSETTTVATFLECENKIHALHRIINGSVDEKDYLTLNGEWDIEEQIYKWLDNFDLGYISFHRSMTSLCNGEITRLFLLKAFLKDADFILLDEPTNHLDCISRQKLYQTIRMWRKGLIVISHDRELLRLMDQIMEMDSHGIKLYGGNYDLYHHQKIIQSLALERELKDSKKLLCKTKRTVQENKKKHEKRQAHGRRLRKRHDQPKMLLDARKNKSTSSQGSLRKQHEKMLETADENLRFAKEQIESADEIKVCLPKSYVPNEKIILKLNNISFMYPNAREALIDNFSLILKGSDRVAIAGKNGSGKTTLVKLILKQLPLLSGSIYIGTEFVRYLDPYQSMLNPNLSILENFLLSNPDANENDAYKALAQFLFKNIATKQLARNLSGGERLRALLACLLMATNPPQLLIMDEPTNNLDLTSIKNIESALSTYQGAMIVISHDSEFIRNIDIKRIIHAPFA